MILVEHASPTQMSMWGPLSGFIVGAPLLFTAPLLLFTAPLLLFTAPLLLFTRQLWDAKREGMESYRLRAMNEALLFENQLQMTAPASAEAATRLDVAVYNQWRSLYEHVEGMRVVPFDLRSFSELVGYATGPFLPLLTLTEKLDSPPVKWLLDRLSAK
jgi:hypothetical protein